MGECPEIAHTSLHYSGILGECPEIANTSLHYSGILGECPEIANTSLQWDIGIVFDLILFNEGIYLSLMPICHNALNVSLCWFNLVWLWDYALICYLIQPTSTEKWE